MRIAVFVLLSLAFCSVSKADGGHETKKSGSAGQTTLGETWLDALARELFDDLKGPVSEALRRQSIVPNNAKVRQAIAALVAIQIDAKTSETIELLKDARELKAQLDPMLRTLLAAKQKGFPSIDGKLPGADVAKLKAALGEAQTKVFGSETAKSLAQAKKQFASDGQIAPLMQTLARFLVGPRGSDVAASILLTGVVDESEPDNRKSIEHMPALLKQHGVEKLAGTAAARGELLARIVGMNDADLSTEAGRAQFDQLARDLFRAARESRVLASNVSGMLANVFNDPARIHRVHLISESPAPELKTDDEGSKNLLKMTRDGLIAHKLENLAEDDSVRKEVMARLVAMNDTEPGSNAFAAHTRVLGRLARSAGHTTETLAAFLASVMSPVKAARARELLGLLAPPSPVSKLSLVSALAPAAKLDPQDPAVRNLLTAMPDILKEHRLEKLASTEAIRLQVLARLVGLNRAERTSPAFANHVRALGALTQANGHTVNDLAGVLDVFLRPDEAARARQVLGIAMPPPQPPPGKQ